MRFELSDKVITIIITVCPFVLYFKDPLPLSPKERKLSFLPPPKGKSTFPQDTPVETLYSGSLRKYYFLTPTDFPDSAQPYVKKLDIWEGLKEQTTAHGIPHVTQARGEFITHLIYRCNCGNYVICTIQHLER